jgi:FKBP-type peptidyl-prolyl cis-trans isomerase
VSDSKITCAIAVLIAATAGLGLGGCDGPNLVPTAAPGIDYHELLPQPKEDDATRPQALGETGKAAPTTASVVVADLEPAPPTAPGETKTTKSGVKYETLKEGTGPVCKAGQEVTIHYVGTLENGQVFDSSRTKGTPLKFAVGTGKVIKGWDEAVPGMKVGEQRKLFIPAAVGYGALGSPPRIPPNAPLIFEVELMDARGG